MTTPAKARGRIRIGVGVAVLLLGLAVRADNDVAQRAAVARSRLPSATVDRTQPADYVHFSFDQVDVASFVKLIGEITGRKFVLSPGVSGKITVVSPRVLRAEVYPLFVSILESTGSSVVKDGDLYRVVPLAPRAAPLGPLTHADDVTPEEGIVTKVMLLEHVTASDVARALEPKVSAGKQGGIAAIEETNHLILTDTGAAVRELSRIVDEIDQPGLARVTEVVQLTYASAEDMADQLNVAMAERISRGQQAAHRLPSARRVATTIQGKGDATVVAAPHSNSLILVGTPTQLVELKRMIAQMDIDSPSGRGRMNAIFLEYLSAEEAAASINGLLEQRHGKNPQIERRVAIQASVANNAVLVDAAPGDFEVVRKLVEQLDRQPKQVHIRVLIAEHKLEDNYRFDVQLAGVDLPSAKGETVIQGSSTFASSADSVLNSIQSGIFPSGITVGLAYGSRIDDAGNVTVSYPGLLGLDAVKEKGDFRVLSETSLEAQDNREASVSVVEEIPILKSTIEGGSGTARDVIQNIERIDVGIKLKLTPHVINNGDVRMELKPSIEAVMDSGNLQGLTPTIARREVSTTVTVPDGRTIVIAGLTREDSTEVRRRVPILGSIPLLGMLFRQTVEQREQSNLLIFVTPYVVSSDEVSDGIRREWELKTGLPEPPDSP